MLMVITSDESVETSFPLLRKGRPTPSIYFLGRRLVEREVRQALLEGLEEVLVVYENVTKEDIALPEGSYAYWHREAGSVIEALLEAVKEVRHDKLVVQIGSIVAGRNMYRYFLETWTSRGGQVYTLLTSSVSKYDYGIGGLRAQVDFRSGGISDVSRGREGYGFTGLFGTATNLFVDELRSSRNLLEVILRLSERSGAKAEVWPRTAVLINEPRSLLEAVREALREIDSTVVRSSARVSPTAMVEGPVYVDEGAVIDHYAVIKGPAYIGPGAFIGAHSLVRSSVTVEPGTTIGYATEVKRSYIGARAFVGSNCYVADSLIGDESTVRPFVVTVNYEPTEAKERPMEKMGSIIGEKSIVNVGEILRPRTVVEPGSLYSGRGSRKTREVD